MPKRKKGRGWVNQKRRRTGQSKNIVHSTTDNRGHDTTSTPAFEGAELTSLNTSNAEVQTSNARPQGSRGKSASLQFESSQNVDWQNQASTSGYDWSGGISEIYETTILPLPPTRQTGCGCHKEVNGRFLKGGTRHRLCGCGKQTENNFHGCSTEKNARHMLETDNNMDDLSQHIQDMQLENEADVNISTTEKVQEQTQTAAEDMTQVLPLVVSERQEQLLSGIIEGEGSSCVDRGIQKELAVTFKDMQVTISETDEYRRDAASLTANELQAEPLAVVYDLQEPTMVAEPVQDEPVVVEKFYAGSMDNLCPYCSAQRFKGEMGSFNCCHSGKVSLPQLTPLPDELHMLFTSNDARSRNFRENIRCYNSAMAFASMGASVAAPPGRGPYVYKIHGQIYHQSSCLHPEQGQKPQYCQLYILDNQQATAARLHHAHNAKCRNDVFQILHGVLERNSPYAAAYRQMFEIEQQNPHKDVKMWMKKVTDNKRHNLPSHDEVAAIFVGEDGAPTNPDFAVYPRGRPLQRIYCTSPNLDPMVYPLLFPRGDPGWCDSL